jgi:hypothetical protein
MVYSALSHVHDGLVANGGVKALLAKGEDLVLAGGVDKAVFDTVSVFSGASTSTFKELCTEVSGDNVDAKLGHTAGENPIAAGDFQDSFAWLQIQQAFTRGSNQEALEGVAVAHLVIPEEGILIPDLARFLLQISEWTSVFSRHREYPFLSVHAHYKIPFSCSIRVDFAMIWAESVSLHGWQNEQKQRENVYFHTINRPISAWRAVPRKLPPHQHH